MCLRLQVEASSKQHSVPCCAFPLCLTSVRLLTISQLHPQVTDISSHWNCTHLNFYFLQNTKIWVYAFKCHSRQCDSTRGPHQLLHVSRLRRVEAVPQSQARWEPDQAFAWPVTADEIRATAHTVLSRHHGQQIQLISTGLWVAMLGQLFGVYSCFHTWLLINLEETWVTTTCRSSARQLPA